MSKAKIYCSVCDKIYEDVEIDDPSKTQCPECKSDNIFFQDIKY